MNKNLRVRQAGYDERYKTWHTINRNMILYIHRGSGSIISKEKNYPITEGCLCFVGSNKFYYTLPDTKEAYVRSKVFLSNEQLREVCAFFPGEMNMGERFFAGGMVYAQMDKAKMKEIEEIFDGLAHYNADERYGDALLIASYIRLLIHLHENAAEGTFQSIGMIQKAVEYINNHIQEELSIDAVCAKIHVSKYYFCRKFKKHTGLTVMEYILKTRISSAQIMLEDTSITIGEISEKCGFSSQSYFSRAFKEEAGLTPMQYRKKLTQSV